MGLEAELKVCVVCEAQQADIKYTACSITFAVCTQRLHAEERCVEISAHMFLRNKGFVPKSLT